jgi:hypothetical protein
MPPVGFEPTISVGERPQTYGLDRRFSTLNKQYYDQKVLPQKPFTSKPPPPPIRITHWTALFVTGLILV